MLSRVLTGAVRAVNAFTNAVAVVAIMLIMMHSVLNAVLRYLANNPIDGTTTYVAHWYLPAVGFLGFYLAQQGRAHIDARLLFDRFPIRIRLEAELLGLTLFTILCVGFTYFGWTEAVQAWRDGATAGVSFVIAWPVMFVVPLAFALLSVRLVNDIAVLIRDHLRHQRDGTEPYTPHGKAGSGGDHGS